jgi:uncharacterized OB-fold protein
MESATLKTNRGMMTASFAFWTGKFMDKFIAELQNKHFMGIKCPKCQRVIVPPRSFCGKCNVSTGDWVTLPDTGILENYTVTALQLTDKKTKKLKADAVIGLIKLDGADTTFVWGLGEVDPQKVKIGMKVQAVWNDTLAGEYKDLKYFKTVEG